LIASIASIAMRRKGHFGHSGAKISTSLSKMQKGQTATLWHPASNNRLDHSSGGGARPLASYPAAAESPRR
jgi:hypothetical protein